MAPELRLSNYKSLDQKIDSLRSELKPKPKQKGDSKMNNKSSYPSPVTYIHKLTPSLFSPLKEGTSS